MLFQQENVEALSMTPDANTVDGTEDHTSHGKGAGVHSDDGAAGSAAGRATGSAADNNATDKDN